MSPLVTGLGVTILTTSLLLWWVERHAPLVGLMDVPNNRSSHTRPTPRGGGIAIVMGSVAGLLVALAVAEPSVTRASVVVVSTAGLVALVSLADDIRSLPPAVRLAAHITAAAVMVDQLPVQWYVELPGVSVVSVGGSGAVLAVVWVVAVTNIYNFMDGIDGLAGGQGFVAGVAWGVSGLVTADVFVATGGFAIAASCAIFLVRNWPPARIFMGDTGSAFLGFTLASVPLLAAGGPLGGRAWPLGAFVLVPFLFDATLTLIRRLSRGDNLLQPHRSHLYQRLVIAGAPHARVSGTYIALASWVSLVGLGWALAGWPAWAVWCSLVGVASALVLTVQHKEAYVSSV